jgi:hypothetical protein
MACHDANVVALPRRAAVREQAVRVQALQVAMGQLDQLARCLRQCSPESGWSAQHWMIGSTPFRMRLVGARKRLEELVRMSPVDGNAAIHWAVNLNDLRLTAEQKLRDVEACLRTLRYINTSLEERAQKTEIFLVRKSELLNALEELQRLLSCQLPEMIDDSRMRGTNRKLRIYQLPTHIERNAAP